MMDEWMMDGDDKRANGRQIEPRTGGKKANTNPYYSSKEGSTFPPLRQGNDGIG